MLSDKDVREDIKEALRLACDNIKFMPSTPRMPIGEVWYDGKVMDINEFFKLVDYK